MPTASLLRDEKDLARIFRKIEIADCWEWTGCLDTSGYGKLTFRRRQLGVHRVIWLLLVGVIPTGLTIDHLCRNRRCCNPDHLEPVPHRVNVSRGHGISVINAMKTHCKYGHEFTEENTIRVRTRAGNRHCRTCQARRLQEHRARKKAAA